jgi:hypothetical protein
MLTIEAYRSKKRLLDLFDRRIGTVAWTKFNGKDIGTLAGQSLEVFVDSPMCYSCKKILPYLGLELGNPSVIFIDPAGTRVTMQDGAWAK